MALLNVLALLWALPTSLVALTLLGPLWLCGQARPVRWDAGWVWELQGALQAYVVTTPWQALTLGWVVTCDDDVLFGPVVFRHEQRHVRQNLVLGPLFLPLYGLGYLVGVARWAWRRATGGYTSFGETPYRLNPFEADAYAHELSDV